MSSAGVFVFHFSKSLFSAFLVFESNISPIHILGVSLSPIPITFGVEV